VKGPRFPSEELRPRGTDYDFPKPVVPRKIGGSFDNLLSITEDDCNRGIGGKHAASRSGGSTPSGGRLETQANLARQRGVSADSLLNSIDLKEYAVPVSLSANDYEVPTKNYGNQNAINSLDKFIGGKGTSLSWMSSKDSHRPTRTSDQTTCETPKRPSDRHPKNLPTPELKLWDRDSALADYDAPKGSATSSASLDGVGAKNFVGKRQVVQQPARRSVETEAKSEAKSSSKTLKCEIDPAFLASLGEVQSAVKQITSYADKWRACTNPTTKLSIVKQVCVAVWKKLQALIVEFSKCLAKFKGRALAPLADRLGAIKVVTAELEKILNYISSCHPNDIHQGCIDYVTELVIIAKEIEGHLDHCSSFLNSDLGDLLDGANKTPKNANYSRLSNSDDTQSEADKRQKQQRRAPALPPPRVIIKTSEQYEDDFSISAVRYGHTKTPTYGRSFSFDQLSSDYDTPKSSSTEVVSSPNHGSAGKMASVLRSGGARSADVGRTKRDAVVLENSLETFNILQRRDALSPIAPSKLIAGRTQLGLTEKNGRLDISNTAEYDYPTAANEGTTETVANFQKSRESSRDLEGPITVADRRMLVFYVERLNAELIQLKGCCQAMHYRPTSISDGEKTENAHIAQIQALVICAHKLVFIADTLIKKLSGTALKKQLQRQAQEIIDKAKSMALLAKSLLASGRNSNRKQLLEVTDNLLAAAITFQDIVTNGSRL